MKSNEKQLPPFPALKFTVLCYYYDIVSWIPLYEQSEGCTFRSFLVRISLGIPKPKSPELKKIHAWFAQIIGPKSPIVGILDATQRPIPIGSLICDLQVQR